MADLKAIATKAAPSSYGSAENIAAHITAHLELVSTFYRGMLLATLGNPSNLDRKLRVSDLFPDSQMFLSLQTLNVWNFIRVNLLSY